MCSNTSPLVHAASTTIAAIIHQQIRLRKSANLAALVWPPSSQATRGEGNRCNKEKKRNGDEGKTVQRDGETPGMNVEERRRTRGETGWKKREDERGKKEEGRWGIVEKKKKKNRTSKRDRRRKRGIRMSAGTKQSAPLTSLFPQAMPARDCCSVLDSRSRTFTNTYEHVWACIDVYTDCDATASCPGERRIVHHSPTHKYSKSFCGTRVYSWASHSHSSFQENCPFYAIHEEPYFMATQKN